LAVRSELPELLPLEEVEEAPEDGMLDGDIPGLLIGLGERPPRLSDHRSSCV
jgi:hypothetical protein